MTLWHTQSVQQVLDLLNIPATGLNTSEAKIRLAHYGPNELQEQGNKKIWRMLWEQLTQMMVVILIVAALISLFLGKKTEASAILAIVTLFATLGMLQEYRAERAMATLKKLIVPTVRVQRDGIIADISARELVPGDIIVLEAGNAIPADARLLESVNLQIQEATLTGESEAVEKHTDPIPLPDCPLGDRRNMVYLGTAATYGRGRAMVVNTGMRTELGKIARLIQEVEPAVTPLQRHLAQVGQTLVIAGVIAAVVIMVLGVLRGESLADMFLTAISIAVAVVPEGLPAVVTISLALGAQRMLKRNALIRKLPAVETLGSVTVICSDKTGTLTENQMTVIVVDVAGERLNLVETMRLQQPAFIIDENTSLAPAQISPSIGLALLGGMLCNDATLRKDEATGSFHALGDPTECALLIAAARAHLIKDVLQPDLPRIHELPFDSKRKRMTTVHQVIHAHDLLKILPPSEFLAFTKGAVDGLLEISSQIWINNQIQPLTPEWRSRIQNANAELALKGMRVLGVAYRPLSGDLAGFKNNLESDLILLGMVGMMDPPRPAVKSAVKTCQTAGIRPIMITGDHPLTAITIARDLGITQSQEVMTGEMLNHLKENEILEVSNRVSVYARVTPEDKLKIVTALQQQGHIVAMTGDGVNDSPALKKANIGVAMGITGTDVAKEAAEMVLLDDNFATSVAAVEEGRAIFDNLLRFIKFSLGGNFGKVLVMLGAPLLGINVALQPLQLLWLNLLTDGLMGLGLGMEPAEKGTMQRHPRPPAAPILDKKVITHVSWIGILIAVLSLGMGAYFHYHATRPDDHTWQTMIFCTLAFAQIGQAFGMRAAGHSPFSITSNRLFSIVTILAFGLQLAVIYLPFMKQFFKLTPLTLPQLALSFLMGGLVFAAIQIEKTRR